MILLSFKKGQGLGNQLWNYVVLRSVADLNNYKFKLLNYDLFLGKEFLKIKISNTKKEFNNQNINIYREKSLFDIDLKCFINIYDKEVMNIRDNTILEGTLQSEEYLKPSIEIINKYLKIKEKKETLIDFENTCLLNIRGGEYKSHRELILPKSYWLNAMQNIKGFNHKINFKIITDDPSYASKILPEIEIIKGGIKEDFMNLYFCKYAILSNSSFGYFPLKLGKQPDLVIAPKHWSRFGNYYNKWVSPSNIYKDWLWQDINGKIIKKSEIEKYKVNVNVIYSSYNVYTDEKFFKEKSIKNLIPQNFRKYLKKLLSKIFPLYFG